PRYRYAFSTRRSSDFVVDAFFGAGPALDGAQDVVLGHVGRCGLVPGQAQRGIGVGIGPTGTGGHGDFTDDLCPELAALGVLAPLDRKSTRLNSSHVKT